MDRRGYEQDIITNLDVRTSLQQREGREDSPESRYLSIKDTMELHKTQKDAEDNLSVSVMDANKLIKSEFEKMNKIDKFIAEGNQKYLLTGNLNPAKLLEETK